MKHIFLLLLICFVYQVIGQSTYLERTSPNPASAQLFFYDRTSHGTTERNWKIATLPVGTTSTGDKITIDLFGGSHGSTSTFQQTIHLGNRNGFNGYLRNSFGQPYTSVRIRAYEQSDGSIDVYFSLLGNGWKGGSVRVYEGSAIVSVRPTIYENPTDVGASPTGTLVFDSYTQSPGLAVDNAGNVEINGVFKATYSSSRYMTFHSSTDGNSYLNYVGGASNSRLGFQIDGSSKMSILNNGYVGIGTATPDMKLTVQGHVNVGGTGNGTIKARHLTGKSHTGTGYGDLYLQYHTTNPVWIGTQSNPAPVYIRGNVGIGTSSPDEKLTVKGTIHTEEVKVDLSVPGPDYVFEDNYNLRSLEETEAYIKTNMHLPEIPTAKEMEANGVQLGEMNMLLLKKIEELTLYQIEMLKIIKKQQEEIENLKNK